MIDMSQYNVKSTSAAGRLRDFIKNEVGSQQFHAAQLKRAVMAHDPWFAKRNGESVRWAVNDVIRKMLAAGELKVAKGSKRGRVFTLVGEQQ